MCSASISTKNSMEVKKRKRVEEEEEDSINKLPEELLCHILSFLSIRDAALTCVLSKRWRDLFACVPCLDLDSHIFAPRNRPLRANRFIKFVNRVLTLQSNSPMTKLCVRFYSGVREFYVHQWIRIALRRGISDLTIISPPRCTMRPHSVPSFIFFYGNNLTSLKLECMNLGPFRSLTQRDFVFAKLKTLHLDTIDFDNAYDEFALLLSKCPVLEELIVNSLKLHSVLPDSPFDPLTSQIVSQIKSASVSSTTLKRLTIDCEQDLIHLSTDSIYHLPIEPPPFNYIRIFYMGTKAPDTVSFDTPNLLYLNYTDFVARNYPLVKLDSLVEARLDIGLTGHQLRSRDSDEEFKVFGDATKLIMGIHNVQTLHLSADTLEVLSYFCETVPIFHNLNHLSIESNDDGGWESLPLLLINCPNLQTLSFHGLHHRVTDGCGDACDCISNYHSSSSSSCLSSCPLKFLKILDFGATCAEMSLVEHFLKNLQRLEQVIIVLNLDSVQEEGLDVFQVSKALEMAPRASPNCKFKVVNY